MLIRRASDIRTSEITDEQTYLRRREFMRLAGGAAVTGALGALAAACGDTPSAEALIPAPPLDGQTPLANVQPKVVTTDEKLNSFEDITGYNNFYEFGTGKNDPARYAGSLKTSPWTVKIDGLCNKPASYQLEDLIKPHQLEERIYRLRCVEAWSMVIPWVGIPLNAVLKRAEPQGKAAYVAFTTLSRPSEMPGQRQGSLEWPYVEGLRMDEAMHPLTILAVGLYGFKSIKSIVQIRFVEKQPPTSWSIANPAEYGFYSNVNPQVDHPRWSQAREKRLPSLFASYRTQMFNGYGDQVASMYAGMDLKKNY